MREVKISLEDVQDFVDLTAVAKCFVNAIKKDQMKLMLWFSVADGLYVEQFNNFTSTRLKEKIVRCIETEEDCDDIPDKYVAIVLLTEDEHEVLVFEELR